MRAKKVKGNQKENKAIQKRLNQLTKFAALALVFAVVYYFFIKIVFL
jgi:hypothetical protein